MSVDDDHLYTCNYFSRNGSNILKLNESNLFFDLNFIFIFFLAVSDLLDENELAIWKADGIKVTLSDMHYDNDFMFSDIKIHQPYT